MTDASNALELRRVPKQARSRERYDRILSSARKLIAERGNDGVSMREIADSSGMPISSVYQYFPDKNSLLWTLISGHFDRLEADWLAQLNAACTLDDVNTAAQELFEAFVGLCIDDSSFAKLWNSAQANTVLSELDRALNQRIAEAYAQQVLRFAPNADTHRVQRTMLLTATLSSAAIQLAFSEPDSRDEILDDFRALTGRQVARTTQLDSGSTGKRSPA